VLLVAFALLALVSRLFPLISTTEFVIITISTTTVGFLSGVIYIAYQKHTLLSTAGFVDEQLNLKERVSTALEISNGFLQTSSDIAARQLNDTLARVESIDVNLAIPLAWHKRDLALLILAVSVLLGAIMVPNPQDNLISQRRAIQQAIEEQVATLEEISSDITTSTELTESDTELLQAPIRGAIQALSNGDLSREEAVAAISGAEATLKELRSDLANDFTRDGLRSAASSLLNDPAASNFGKALSNGDLFGSAEAASELADELSELTNTEMDDLAQDLAQAAAELREIDPELAKILNQVAQELQSSQIENARDRMEEVATILLDRASTQAAGEIAEAATLQLAQSSQKIAQAGQPVNEGLIQDNEGASGPPAGQAAGADGNGLSISGQGQSGEEGGGPGGPGSGGGRTNSVYVPAPVNLGDEEGVAIQLPAECAGNNANCGALLSESVTAFSEEQSIVPYSQVYAEYRQSAYFALQRSQIPLSMKGYVRDYFSALEP